METSARRVVVVGVGTGVGKTHVACALLQALVRRGERAVGLKPVESGWSPGGDSDARALAASAAGRANARGASAADATSVGEACATGSGPASIEGAPCVGLCEPVSPHLAARNEGVEIDHRALVVWCEAQGGDWQVVETAGGLLTPLGVGVSNLSLTVGLTPGAVVLVGVDRLGALHEVAACMRALEGEGLGGRTVVVLCEPEEADASTGTNGDELRVLGLASCVVAVLRGELAGASGRAAGEALLSVLLAGLGEAGQ